MILLPLTLMASDPPLDCKDPQNQTAMTLCARRAFDAADEELNRQWLQTAAVMKRADRADSANADGRPGYFESLLEAQRAWVKMRDAHCRIEGYDARGGSLEPMLVNICLERLTRARVEQLESLRVNQVSGEPKNGEER